jgi:hypothetical protein
MSARGASLRQPIGIGLLVSALVLLLLAAVPAGAIVGGSALSGSALGSGGAYGWLVRLEGGGATCTGSLVTQEWVLTAAHCVPAGGDASAIEAFLGADPTPTPVAEVVVSPRVGQGIDLALLRLAVPTSRPPVRLVGADHGVAVGDAVTIAGWGTTSGSSDELPAEPRHASTVVEHVSSVELFTGGPGVACSGDSGGPMVHGGLLAAVISVSDAGCTEFTGGIRVVAELPWISDVTGLRAGNQAPFARSGELEATPGGTVEIPLDYGDPDGDPVEITATNLDELAGLLDLVACDAVEPPFTCTFQVAPSVREDLTFLYAVSDGLSSATASWLVRVTVVNTAPVAHDDSLRVRADRPEPVQLQAEDADGDVVTFAVDQPPAHGVLDDCSAGSCTYTPADGYIGPDVFTFTAGDGALVSAPATVSVDVVANGAPVAGDAQVQLPVSGGSFALPVEDPDGDPLTARILSGPSEPALSCIDVICTYTPTSDSDVVELTFEATDGLATSGIGTVRIEVLENLPPVVASGAVRTKQDLPVLVDLDANDPEQDPIAIELVDGPRHGTVTDCSATRCRYVPDPGFAGQDAFTWQASDGSGTSDVATTGIVVLTTNWSVQPLRSPEDASRLAAALADGGTVRDVVYRGALAAAGSFAGAEEAIGIDRGVVLGSGEVARAVGPNLDGFSSLDHGLPGDARIDALAGVPTADAAVLELVLEPVTSPLVLSVVWASEEYPDSVGTEFDDTALVAVDGAPCTLPGDHPLSVSGVNGGSDLDGPTNPTLFRDNAGGDLDVEFDGLTTVIECAFEVEPGAPVSVVLGVADGTDGAFDSALFVQGAPADPLEVSIGGDLLTSEGSAVPVVGSVSRSDGVAAQWSYQPMGDVDPGASCAFADPTALSTTFTCTDDGTYLVLLHAEDDAEQATASATVVVANVGPTVDSAVASTSRRTLTVAATVSDPGSNDALSCEVESGGVVLRAPVEDGRCSITGPFDASEGRTVVVTMRDDDGGEATSVVRVGGGGGRPRPR